MTTPAGDGWTVVFSKQARKDSKHLSAAGLRPKTEQLIALLRLDPFASPPSFELPRGRLEGTYSRRINIQHRLVYEVFESERVVRILRMWSHCE